MWDHGICRTTSAKRLFGAPTTANAKGHPDRDRKRKPALPAPFQFFSQPISRAPIPGPVPLLQFY
jgi:hypothetical protein